MGFCGNRRAEALRAEQAKITLEPKTKKSFSLCDFAHGIASRRVVASQDLVTGISPNCLHYVDTRRLNTLQAAPKSKTQRPLNSKGSAQYTAPIHLRIDFKGTINNVAVYVQIPQ